MSNPNIPTPHITAKEGDFARTVLMPGDPLRSKFIAETYLENPVLVNDTRGVQGYTGLYHGKRVSVMASGMGIPSIGIYSYELFNFYGVENIIRVGTAGGLSDSVNVRDVVIGLSSYTNSNFGRQFGFDGNVAPCCSFKLLEQAVAAARRMGIEPTVGPLYSSDIFYDESGMSGKLQEAGRAGGGDGIRRAVSERGARGQERARHLHHFGSPQQERIARRAGAPNPPSPR